jgi:hypothetical protein
MDDAQLWIRSTVSSTVSASFSVPPPVSHSAAMPSPAGGPGGAEPALAIVSGQGRAEARHPCLPLLGLIYSGLLPSLLLLHLGADVGTATGRPLQLLS